MAQKGNVGNLLVSLRADLGQLRFDVKEMENTFKGGFSNISKSAAQFGKGLAAGLLGGLSVGAIVSFGKSVVDAAGHVQDLSEQVGISGQLLSGLRSTLEENGTTLDAFAKGIFTAQRELGQIKNQSDPAAQAVKALGLNLNELRQADTETFLKLVTDALGKIENPMQRNALGAQLLGKQFRELGPAIQAMAGRLEELKRGGVSEQDIKTLDAFGDSWTKLSNSFKIFAAGPMADVINGLRALFGLLTPKEELLRKLLPVEDVLAKINDQLTVAEDLRASGSRAGVASDERYNAMLATRNTLTKQATDLAQQVNKLNTPGVKPPPFVAPVDSGAQKAIDSFIAGLRKQADALKINQIELGGGAIAAKEMGLNLEFAAFKAAHGTAVSARLTAQFEALKKEILSLNIGLAKTKELLERLAIDEADFAEGRKAQVTAALAPFKLQDANEIQRTAEAAERAARDFDDIAEATRAWDQIQVDAARHADELTIALQSIDKEAAIVGFSFDKVGAQIEAFREQLRTTARGPEWDELKIKFDTLVDQKSLQDSFRGIGDSISRGIHETLTGINQGTQTLGEGLTNALRNVFLSLNTAIIEATIVKPIADIVNSFFEGLAEAFADGSKNAAKGIAKDLGLELGKWLKEALGGIGGGGGGGIFSSIGSFFSSIFSGIGSLFGFEKGGLVPSFAKGGLVGLPSFASGGPVPIIAHGGEFVMNRRAVDSIGSGALDQANRTGRFPQSGGSRFTVQTTIMGDIVPRQPDMTKDDVVKTMIQEFDNRGPAMLMMEQRTMLKKG